MAQEKSTQIWKTVLQQNLVHIGHSMKTDRLVPYLIQHDIISDDDMDTLKDIGTETEKAEWLINHLRRYASDEGFKILMYALREERQNHVADFIDDKLKELTMTTAENKFPMSRYADAIQVPLNITDKDKNYENPLTVISECPSVGLCKHHKAGCTEVVAKENLDYHIEYECQYRPTPCKNCGKEMPLNIITEHFSVCSGQMCVKCPLCSRDFSFSEIKRHVAQCQGNCQKPCHFFKKGCSFKGSSADMDQHNQVSSSQHMELLLTHIEGMDNNYQKLLSKITEIERTLKKPSTPPGRRDSCIQTNGCCTEDLQTAAVTLPASLAPGPKYRGRCMSSPTVIIRPVATVSPSQSRATSQTSLKLEDSDQKNMSKEPQKEPEPPIPELPKNSAGRSLLKCFVNFVCKTLSSQTV
ncbi:uncharacterized protein LOC106163228 [Lingula anatina]|uniref:Uncharacterized protein LOC106163228 n=1 Tax=Lingula anatina TaxID=7574 RepID=A0A1S3ID64_LINAN|nr:uncharacterized protein LOC106163228 [Lingula anatina]|eukprot:XP_013396205.1 uncharacterized protein LOC106163228 [Lingula anatina]